jgi:hypothetical protein
MPPRRAKETGLPAVNCPVLFDYSEQLAILLFGQLMKWLRPMVRRGNSIPLADLKNALWAVKEAWELHRDIARASGPQHLTAVPADELDALTAGYDPLIEARELSVADKRRLQAHLAHRRQVADAENQQQATLPPAVMSLRSIMLSYSAPSLGIEPILSCIEPVMLSWCKPAWRFTLRIATFHI